jgi:hypothetical protein
MVDQYTPDGTLTYKKKGFNSYQDSTGKWVRTPKFSATTKLSPGQQAIYDLGQQTETNIATIGKDQSARIGDLLSTPVNFDGSSERYNPNLERMGDFAKMGQLSTNDWSADRQKVEDALMARMQPNLDRDQAALETKLTNQGVRPGSAAYDDAMRAASVGSNDARMAAILAGGQEQSRLFGLDMSRMGFNNEALSADNANNFAKVGFNNALEQQLYGNSVADRAADNQETMTLRNQPINEISALLSGSQVNNPQFANTPSTQVAGTDYMGMVQSNYQQQMEAWKQQVASKNAMMGGMFGLAAAPFSMFRASDERVKKDIEQVGEANNGLPVYSFRYKGQDGPKLFGLMAQDVEKVKPHAVATHPSGVKMVNYDEALA